MNLLKDLDLKNKRVVLRCDLNVPIENGKIVDNSKIIYSVPTIRYLLENNCSVCILSHLGRVKSETDKKKNSLEIVAKELANVVKKPVKFVDNCYGEKTKEIVLKNKLGSIVLLQNTRWMDFPEKKESGNDLELAKYWASLGEIFVNDAFGSLHRAHASTAGIAKYIPNCLGYLVEREIRALAILIKNTPHPFTVFMGGAKVDDKLPIIKKILPKCDYLLVGGGIANSFYKAKGAELGNSLATEDNKILEELQKILQNYKDKIILPKDFILDDGAIYDIGPKSIERFKNYIEQSEVIFVNGTCGKYEDERFTEGTIGLFTELKESGKKVIIGGGDAVSAVKKFGFERDFEHLSTGGGATLEFIADGMLEALEWMK